MVVVDLTWDMLKRKGLELSASSSKQDKKLRRQRPSNKKLSDRRNSEILLCILKAVDSVLP